MRAPGFSWLLLPETAFGRARESTLKGGRRKAEGERRGDSYRTLLGHTVTAQLITAQLVTAELIGLCRHFGKCPRSRCRPMRDTGGGIPETGPLLNASARYRSTHRQRNTDARNREFLLRSDRWEQS